MISTQRRNQLLQSVEHIHAKRYSEPMATLGDLERAVMDLLWDADDPAERERAARRASRPASRHRRDAASPRPPCSRCCRGSRPRVSSTAPARARPHLYRAVSGRAEHTAELMHEVLGTASDRDAALARFVGQVSPEEAEMLRALLAAQAAGLEPCIAASAVLGRSWPSPSPGPCRSPSPAPPGRRAPRVAPWRSGSSSRSPVAPA